MRPGSDDGGDHTRRSGHHDAQHGPRELIDLWIWLHEVPACSTDRQDLKLPIKQINELAPKWYPVPFFVHIAFLSLMSSQFVRLVRTSIP